MARAPSPAKPWTGRSVERVEDAALLTGRGRFIDDLASARARGTPRSCGRRMPTP